MIMNLDLVVNLIQIYTYVKFLSICSWGKWVRWVR